MTLAEDLGLTEWPNPEPTMRTVKFDGPFRIDISEMLYNWRIIISAKDNYYESIGGWCYFGKSLETFLKAIAYAQDWDPTTQEEPDGYDKEAFYSPEVRNGVLARWHRTT